MITSHHCIAGRVRLGTKAWCIWCNMPSQAEAYAEFQHPRPELGNDEQQCLRETLEDEAIELERQIGWAISAGVVPGGPETLKLMAALAAWRVAYAGG